MIGFNNPDFLWIYFYMMKKFFFSFLVVLVGVCWFGGISSATEIDAINISNVSFPVVWQRLSTVNNSATSLTYGAPGYKAYYFNFYVFSWDEWNLLPNEQSESIYFKKDKNYKLEITLQREWDYEFSGSITDDDILINWDTWHKVTDYESTTDLLISKEFTPAYTTINSIWLTWIVYPLAWTNMWAEFARIQKDDHSVSLDEYYSNDYHFYVVSWDNWVRMWMDDYFNHMSWYRLDIFVSPEIGYIFGDDLTWSVNGEELDGDITISGDRRVLSKEFIAYKIISSINFSGVTLVQSWDDINEIFQLWEVDDAILSWYEYTSYVPVKWVDGVWVEVDTNNEPLAVTWTNYWFKVRLVVSDNFKFSDNLTFKYNWVNLNYGHTYFDLDWDDKYLYIDLWTVGVTNSNNNSCTSGCWSSSTSPSKTTTVWWSSSWWYSRSSTPSTNTEIKKVEQTGDALIYSWTNELIPVDYLKEELEKNKELYKNAPIKVMVALLNLTRADLFRLKNTADAYKKATPEVKKNVLAVLNWLANDNSKRAKYVSDYFKFIAGIE